jgi:hypothetical protein
VGCFVKESDALETRIIYVLPTRSSGFRELICQAVMQFELFPVLLVFFLIGFDSLPQPDEDTGTPAVASNRMAFVPLVPQSTPKSKITSFLGKGWRWEIVDGTPRKRFHAAERCRGPHGFCIGLYDFEALISFTNVFSHRCRAVILKEEDVMLAAVGSECSGELGRRWPPVGDEGYVSNRSN